MDRVPFFKLGTFYNQSQLYQKITESQSRSKLATELMIYHMQVCTVPILLHALLD